MTRRPTLVTRRATLGLAVLATSSACSLRLESDSPIPGPTASAAPDTKPLTAVRTHLVGVMAAAQGERTHVTEARAAQGVHREQLRRVDATLDGLGQHAIPTATATADPTTSNSTTSSSASASSGSASSAASPPSSKAAPGASSSVSSSPSPTPWTRAESGWAASSMSATLHSVSAHSRPLALAIAARGLSLLPADSTLPWPTVMTLPATPLLAPTSTAIDALEWLVATTPLTERKPAASQLHALYAVRSLADAADPSAATRTATALSRYQSAAQATKTVGACAQQIMAACAKAAAQTPASSEVTGLLYVWTSAITLAEFCHLRVNAFPGLAS